MKKTISIILAVLLTLSIIPASVLMTSAATKCPKGHTYVQHYCATCREFEKGFTGMAKRDGVWQYVTNGKADNYYTGLAKNQYGWWYLTNGKIDYKYVGMAKNQYAWWYVKNGTIDFTYTGMAQNRYGWWYMKNGKLYTKYTGMAPGPEDWMYVTNGKLDTSYTGMAKNQYGWWYISKGRLNRNFTGMAKNRYGWWYLTKGGIDYSYTGIGENDYGNWYIKNGKLDTSYTGKYLDSQNNVWTITKGKAVNIGKLSITVKDTDKDLYLELNASRNVSVKVSNPGSYDTVVAVSDNKKVAECQFTSGLLFTAYTLKITLTGAGKTTVTVYFKNHPDIKQVIKVSSIGNAYPEDYSAMDLVKEQRNGNNKGKISSACSAFYIGSALETNTAKLNIKAKTTEMNVLAIMANDLDADSTYNNDIKVAVNSYNTIASSESAIDEVLTWKAGETNMKLLTIIAKELDIAGKYTSQIDAADDDYYARVGRGDDGEGLNIAADEARMKLLKIVAHLLDDGDKLSAQIEKTDDEYYKLTGDAQVYERCLEANTASLELWKIIAGEVSTKASDVSKLDVYYNKFINLTSSEEDAEKLNAQANSTSLRYIEYIAGIIDD